MDYGFFALTNRMKYINRWQLMRCEHTENLAEHSFEVAVIAHALVSLANKRNNKSLNADRAAFLALYHDMPETITGDMPTPVKHGNEELEKIYACVEENACKKLLKMLPEDLREDYSCAFEKTQENEQIQKYVKAADRISAYIKCIEEKKAGNAEFTTAAKQIYKSIKDLELEEADIFLETFIPAYSLTLDEIC